ncbi:MAG: hypothetical protein DBX91_09040 [Subdoligranulum variabile]|nr:MAG: hypothetical protein DBX91_09040 [Subdoligranulum variabile]
MKHQAMNPYLPLYEYVPDGEPRVFNGRLYIYGSHDKAGASQFCVGDYVVWSAPLDNLGKWRCEGLSYTYKQTGSTIEESGNLAAPDCVQGPDGRYYLFYNRGARNACEVAVSDRPHGPFRYLANVAFPDGTEPNAKLFDPGVLIDGDGRIYLYTGFVPTPDSPWASVAGRYSLGFELAHDMHTILAGPIEVLPGCLAAKGSGFEGHGFYEASSPRKINGQYYLVYSSEQSHDLCYAVSNHPLTGYRYGGILVSNGDFGYRGNHQAKAPYGNTHGGLVELNGQWYIFYHRQTHGIECCRQGCAEPVELDAEGHFHQAEMTSCGLNGGPLAGLGTYSAAYACNLTHESIGRERLTIRRCVRNIQPHIYEQQAPNGLPCHALHYIANMQNGTVAGFKYFTLGQATKIRLCLRANAPGRMDVFLDENRTQLAASLPFDISKDWQWLCGDFCTPAGTFPLFFHLHCFGRADWMAFELC